MKKTKITALMLSALLVVCAVLFVACGENRPEYQVTFDYQTDGVNSTVVTVKENDKVKTPAEPTRSGYTFNGWYSDAAATTEFDFTKGITSDVTVYAGWEKGGTYVFEAEYTRLKGLKGQGYSSEALGVELARPDGETEIGKPGPAKASNGFYVSYLYKKGLTLTFNITSDAEVDDATLIMRLSAEMFPTVELTDEEWLVKVNDEKMEYGKVTIDNINTDMDADKREFQDFTVTTALHLNEGVNVITLTVNNDTPMLGAAGATAPLVDCIKIKTSAGLTWEPVLKNLEDYE